MGTDIDFVIGVGGGSVIDASKGIASAAMYDGDPWDFYSYKVESKGALPIASILTLAATGSEMNGGSVVTNFEVKILILQDFLFRQQNQRRSTQRQFCLQ